MQAVGRIGGERVLAQRLRQAADLGGEMALPRDAGLADGALSELERPIGVGVVPEQQEDVDLGAVEQPGADLSLVDLAGVGDPGHVEVVDREGQIVADCGTVEAGR
jgi:hypothetical protein